MLQEMCPAGHNARALGTQQILRMATEQGAATIPFAGQSGRLTPEMLANPVVIHWAAVRVPWQEPT